MKKLSVAHALSRLPDVSHDHQGNQDKHSHLIVFPKSFGVFHKLVNHGLAVIQNNSLLDTIVPEIRLVT
jgi:hypothetical protein